MLVNVSRFTQVQGTVARLISQRLQLMKDAIQNRYAVSTESALRDPFIASLHASWKEQYQDEPEAWGDIQKSLHQASAGMSVVEINASRNSGRLDYRAHEGVGLNVIAVGGNSLSRGFTLEGLTVSYFLRNTQMYDTLLQMGRWFGYRDGYGSLCRLFLKQEASDWYAFIADATEELRDEIARMEAAGLTPEDFGLAVRSHPGSLLVTARNKMSSANEIVRQVGLANRLVESAVLHADQKPREFNVERARALLAALKMRHGSGQRVAGDLSSILFRNVAPDVLLEFISAFAVQPANVEMQPDPLSEYIRQRGFELWDVAVISSSGAKQEGTVSIQGFDIGLQNRSMMRHKNALQVSGSKRRVASRGVEALGLTEGELAEAKQAHQEAMENKKAGETIADRFYRASRTRPLFMLHFLKAVCKGDEVNGTMHAAYGISFPGLGEGEVEKRVSYVANLVAFRQIYGQLDAEGDEDDEIEDA
jgi:hypothetical protein